jgi:hypothetical protein
MANSVTKRPPRARYSLPAAHAFLYLVWWASYAVSNQGLTEGFTGLFFTILFIADLPFSFVAFGLMFEGGRNGQIASIMWGIVGTLWWGLIGLAIDAFIRRRSRPER